jgi:hypothetical protein
VRVLQRDPNHALAYENQANSLLALKRKHEAKLAIEQALKIYTQRNDSEGIKRAQNILSTL